MSEVIDLSSDPDEESEGMELKDDENVHCMDGDEGAEEKRRRRRRLKFLLNPSVTPSFIAIISPNYQDFLPKRIRVNINERIGVPFKKPRLTIQLPAKPTSVPSFQVAPLPQDEGYYEGLVPLGQPDDSLYLNELHLLIRNQLELFSATDDDVHTTHAGRRTPTVRGKVGVRCVHCAKVALKHPVATRIWSPGSVSYPINVEGLYSVCTQKVQLHFESCPNIPDEVKAQMYRLSYDASGNSIRRQNLNNAGHSSMSAGTYYLVSAKRIGLQNVPGGIRFGRDLRLQPLAVESVRGDVETQFNGGKKVICASQLRPTAMPDPIAPRITADEGSEGALAAAFAEEDSETIIGRSGDSKLVTDFVFLCVRQMAYCHVVPTDFESRGKKTALMRLGFTGFCCRHCREVNNPETSVMVVDYSCRSFTSAADNLSSAIMNSFYGHLQKCYLVPIEIRKALAAYKKIHPRQISRLAHGSQRRLFHAIWDRLRARDVSEEEIKTRLMNAPNPAPRPPVQLTLEAPTDMAIVSIQKDTPQEVHSRESIPDEVASVHANAVGHSICHPQCDDVETVAILKAAEDNHDSSSNDNLIIPSDRALVTDYVFFMMRNMRIAIPNSTDYARGRRSTNLNTRLAGFCCKFCHGQDGSISATGRSFPSAPDNMASSLNTSMYNHMLRCFYVPDNVKRAVTNLKRLHSQQCGNLKFGSQRRFFNLVYARLQAVDVPHELVDGQVVIKTKSSAQSIVGDEILTQLGFIRISTICIECSRCRSLPLSLRAPNACSTNGLNAEALEYHKQKCTGRNFYLGWVVDAMNTMMDQIAGVTYGALVLNSFKALLQELLGEPVVVESFLTKFLELLRHARGDQLELSGPGVTDPNAEHQLVGQVKSDVDSGKVVSLFEKWANEIGVEPQLQANKSFFHFFQLLSPAI
jgi:hypothetical protein